LIRINVLECPAGYERVGKCLIGAFGMVNLLLRPVMLVAAVIAGWFVARDSVNFTVIQMVVSLFLITLIVAIAAFWETLSDWVTNKKKIKS
jgi:hypothetical protein